MSLFVIYAQGRPGFLGAEDESALPSFPFSELRLCSALLPISSELCASDVDGIPVTSANSRHTA